MTRGDDVRKEDRQESHTSKGKVQSEKETVTRKAGCGSSRPAIPALRNSGGTRVQGQSGATQTLCPDTQPVTLGKRDGGGAR